jgi:hypothetical protein
MSATHAKAATWPVDELLRACRDRDLDYRANPDGPWRARCPICRTTTLPDDPLPLTITRTGHISCRNRCDPAKIAEALDNTPTLAALPDTLTTWAPVSLEHVLAGQNPEPLPCMLSRTDGRCLLYPERIHALHAEPEGLKTWLALKASAGCLLAGEIVLWIDFEDTAASIVQRLIDLGISAETIAGGFIYIRPDEPLADAAMLDLDSALARRPQLAIIDGVTEAFSRQGLNPLDNSDVATWLALLPRKLVRAGAAVLLLDHVVKDREQRGRYAIGAQHKLAGVDVAYSMRVLEPFARGREGLVAIKVEKDRPGRIREFATDGQVALLHARSEPNGAVRISLEPPDTKDTTFRPTVLMGRVAHSVESDPGLSKRAIRETVGGKATATDLALELLISEHYIEARREGQASRHYSLKPYENADEPPDRVPVSQPCPNRVPDTVRVDRVPVSPPVRDTDTGHSSKDTPENADRVPTHEATA